MGRKKVTFVGKTSSVVLFLTLWRMGSAADISEIPEGVWIAGGRYVVPKETQNDLISRAMRQCIQMISSLPSTNETVCSATWDWITCWGDAKPGQIISQPCPNYVHNFHVHENVTRRCMENGSWYVNPSTGEEWSDYGRCDQKDNTTLSPLFREHVPKIAILYNIGYGISLISLLVAVFIMLYFRKLRCPRNTLHLNLFLSFILRSLMSFLRENLFINKLGLPQDVSLMPNGQIGFLDISAIHVSHWECKTITFIWLYSLSANYIWIFMEGLYLHTLIIVSVFSEQSTVVWYIVFGWLTPFTFLIPWAIVRAKLHNIYCWNISEMPEYEWIYKGPLLLLILVNFGIFINILRVLFTKLRASNTREGRRYRKLAKSTLVLIPLFGVHYILFSLVFNDKVSDVVEIVKLYFEMICNSFQGFLVALLYCFLNGEVQSEIKKKWHRFQLHRSSQRSHRNWSSSKTMNSTNGMSIIDTTCPSMTFQTSCRSDSNRSHKNGAAGSPHRIADVNASDSQPKQITECGEHLLEGNDDCFVSESGFTEIMCMGDGK